MKNLILVVSGPAGSGKNTVSESLMKIRPNIERVITTTSRPPRGAEVDGVDYHFMSPEDFEAAIERGEFYEYARVHGRHYGTSKRAIQDSLAAGKDLILIIDVQGADAWRGIAMENPDIAQRLKTVFIAPSSEEELRQRLRGRGTESAEEIDKRMTTAISEMKRKDDFDFRLDSKTKEDDLNALCAIYDSLKNQ